jgi:hypothetical protein
MGAITILCVINLERAVAFPTSHMVCVETAPKCIVHRQHASSMLAVIAHPPCLQGRLMAIQLTHNIILIYRAGVPLHICTFPLYPWPVPLASLPTPHTHHLATLTLNAERARPHSHRTERVSSYPMTLTASTVGDHRPPRVDPLLMALLAWPRAHV